MKFKPGGKGGGLLVELSPEDTRLPFVGQTVGMSAEFNLKKILVPIDFSECSKKALQYAVPLAKQFGAEITVLHVIHYPIQAPELMLTYAQNAADARKELRALRDGLNGIVSSQAVLKEGKPPVEIVKAAVESGADLVILSTHGRSGLAHALLGSTAERVVRYAPCPVLVVREREREFVADQLAA